MSASSISFPFLQPRGLKSPLDLASYVPLKVDYSDLFPILAFFQGSPYDGSGSHDDLAEKIATAGAAWARDFWRWEDMQA